MSTPVIPAFRSHPAYAPLLKAYRASIMDWHASDTIQEAARTLGMNARTYADSRVRGINLAWVSSNTTGAVTQADIDLVYDDAVRDVCGTA